jgi:hypothetical protein
VIAANEGFVVVGYVLTVAALGGYTWSLFVRARSARRRAEAIASRRR